MIDNTGKSAVLFGVRNDRSLVWAVARRLHASGCRVALTCLPADEEEVRYLVASHGMDGALVGRVDVREDAQVAGFLAEVAGAWGEIHYLLHGTAFGSHRVMGTSPPGDPSPAGTFLDIPFDDLADAFNISAYALLRICRCAAPHLSDGASVLTLSFQASEKVLLQYGGMAVCKAALENIAAYLAAYFGPRGIRVNTISPGLVMTTSAAGVSGVRRLRKLGGATAPLGNVRADDVADAALWYFSDLSRKVTGNVHYVDGGLHIMGGPLDA